MSTEELKKEWALANHLHFNYEQDHDSDNLAALASKDGEESIYAKEAYEDQRIYRGHYGQMAGMYLDELKHRGLVPDFRESTGIRTVWTEYKGTDDPTGHYDDGHAFGWSKKTDTDTLDTGHYDDGHAFGWPKRNTVVAVVAAIAVLLAAVGIGVSRSAQVAGDTATAAPSITTAASAAGTVAATRPATAVTDPCTLVTKDEATSLLAGQAVTIRTFTPPSTQCEYDPSPAAVFSFQETSRTARITITGVVITYVSGADAASRFAAKQNTTVKDRDDQDVSGIGDKAVYRGGSDLSVLRGTTFINVTTRGDRDWGDGNTRYEDVHQKYLSVLVAFARDALARAP